MLHWLRDQLDFYNSEVDLLMLLFEKTFDSAISAESHASVLAMLDEGYRRIVNRALLIVESIDLATGRHSEP